MKFHEKLFVGSQVMTCRQTDRQTDEEDEANSGPFARYSWERDVV